MISRDEALQLLKKYNKNESLINHALAVEAVMAYFAGRFGEDEQYWRVVGLLHDIDYEKYPQDHCRKSEEILRNEGVGEDIIHAVVSHGWGICSDVEPIAKMEKVLYTIDELTGLTNAAALMRPGKSILDMETSSVKKKFKSKNFAAGVDRDLVIKGCDMLGMELDEVLAWTLEGMKKVASRIGLGGNDPGPSA